MKNKSEQPDELTISKVERVSIARVEGLPIRDFDKVDLVLLLAGLKIAIDINVPRDNNDWQNIIKYLGLYFLEDEELGDESKRKIYVARSQEDVEKLRNAFKQSNDIELGILSGYPLSAVENYNNTTKELLNLDLKEADVANLLKNRYMELVDLPPDVEVEEILPFIHFHLSTKNWKGEIEVVRKWVDTIKDLDPDLYTRITDYYKK